MTDHDAGARGTSRRHFMGGLGALGAAALLTSSARAQIGHRIDVHHHIFPRPLLDLQERLTPGGGRLAPTSQQRGLAQILTCGTLSNIQQ